MTSIALNLTIADRADDIDETELGPARCSDGSGSLTFLFFSDDDFELARAKAICRRCTSRAACLAGAIEREEPSGVWGAMVFQHGLPGEVKRRKGRPPRVPAPTLVVDDVPLPPHLVA